MQKTAGHTNHNIIKHLVNQEDGKLSPMDNTLLIFRPKVLFSKALADQYYDRKLFVYKKFVSVLKDWFHQFHQNYDNVFYAKSLYEYV